MVEEIEVEVKTKEQVFLEAQVGMAKESIESNKWFISIFEKRIEVLKGGTKNGK